MKRQTLNFWKSITETGKATFLMWELTSISSKISGKNSHRSTESIQNQNGIWKKIVVYLTSGTFSFTMASPSSSLQKNKHINKHKSNKYLKENSINRTIQLTDSSKKGLWSFPLQMFFMWNKVNRESVFSCLCKCWYCSTDKKTAQI